MYLHSNRLNMGNVGYFEFVKADTAYLFHSTRFGRMEYYDSMHAVQAKIIKTQLNKTPHPYIFCADMNTVPSGFVYQHLKEGLRDAFLMAGSGLGGTYHRFSFSLRIDNMLTSPQFTGIQFSSPHLDLSDHYLCWPTFRFENDLPSYCMAKNIFRRAAKTIFVSINILMVLLFLVACLSVYLNPAFWWMTGFTGLIVPYLVLFLVLFIIFWLSVKPILVLISISTLLIGWQQLYVLFAWHPVETFVKHKHAEDVRIIDWNVRSFNGLAKTNQKKIVRVAVAETILRFNADILCLQEFNSGLAEDNISLFSHQYPYHFFSQDYRRDNGKYQSWCIIFSKFPIVDSGKTKYPVAESLIYADVVKDADTFRVFTTHLQSFKFKKADYNDIEKIKEQEDDNLAASKNIFRKMKLAFSRRGVQAGLVREAIDKCDYPSVICGDFNDVPNSYAYHTILGDDRQDAFLKKSFGIGRSFNALAPTLRIDYILPDFRFDVRQFEMVDEDLSDHLMLISDIRLKK